MFTPEDLDLFAEKGIDVHTVEEQLASFKSGFPFLRILSSASVGNGILSLDEQQTQYYLDLWEGYLKDNHKVVKFVPASGAASRMFKDLFAFLSADYSEPQTDFEKKFFNSIEHFAFYSDLDEACLKNEGRSITDLIESGQLQSGGVQSARSEGLELWFFTEGVIEISSLCDE